MTTAMSRTTDLPPVQRPEFGRHPFGLVCLAVVAFLVVIAVLGFGVNVLAAG